MAKRFFPLIVLTFAWSTSALAGGQPIADTSGGTGEKPQSKLWYADQKWWAVITRSGEGLHFFEFDGTQWTPSTFMDANISSSGRADVRWNVDTDELFVLAYTSSPKLFKYHYDRELGTYNLLPGFPVSIPKTGGSETMVMDQDSTGRLWVTWEGEYSIWVNYTTSEDHLQWATPLELRSGVSSDDISTIVAFDGNVGVLWSDQQRDEFGFRMHRDTDPPDFWQPLEIAGAGDGFADDHLCMKANGEGELFAVTKDDNDEMYILRRKPHSGEWSTHDDVINGEGTRGSLMLRDADEKVYVLYTSWSSSSNKIKLRRAGYKSLNFSTYISSFISGGTFNNATGTKQVLPESNFMGLAHGEGDTYWNGWGELPPDGPPPPEPPLDLSGEMIVTEQALVDRATLALHLPMDEGTGLSTTGTTASQHRGDFHAEQSKNGSGPLWTQGQDGMGLAFDGGSYISIASAPSLEIAGSFSLEAWVRPHADFDDEGTILSKGRSNQRNYHMLLNSDRQIYFLWEVASGSNRGLTGNRILPTEEWTHVACVYDKSNGESRLYINGELDDLVSDSGTPYTNDEPLHLGRRIFVDGQPKDHLKADLDGIRIWRGVAFDADFAPGVMPEPAPERGRHEPRRSVELSWQPPANEERTLTYSVQARYRGGSFTLATGLTSTSFTHRNPNLGTTCYEIRAHSLEDNRTGDPATICFDIENDSPPPKNNDERPQLSQVANRAPTLSVSPNPFNPRTRIRLSQVRSGAARLVIYDVRGRMVNLLFEGTLPAGDHEFSWNGRAHNGQPQSSGVYFLRARLGDRVIQKRLTLLK